MKSRADLFSSPIHGVNIAPPHVNSLADPKASPVGADFAVFPTQHAVGQNSRRVTDRRAVIEAAYELTTFWDLADQKEKQ